MRVCVCACGNTNPLLLVFYILSFGFALFFYLVKVVAQIKKTQKGGFIIIVECHLFNGKRCIKDNLELS